MSDSFLRLGFKSQLPCSVATSQPLSLHPYFPCCSGPHNYSAVPFSCTQSSAFPSSAPLASSTSSLASLRGSCLAPSGCNPCGVNSSARASHRAILDHPSTTTITTSTTSAHFCSNSLHLNVERTVCGNGAHFCCQECFLQPKISPTSESEKAWPKVPAPHAASVPVPICNGCGTSSDAMDGSEGREVQLINRKSLRLLTSQLLALLMSQDDGQVTRGMKVEELSRLYLSVHGTQLNPCEYGFLSLSELLKSLPYLVELYQEGSGDGDASGPEDEWVRLARLYQFARNVRALLHTYHYNQIFLTEFQGAYNKFTGCSLEPRSYGYFSADELLGAIPQVVWIKGHGHKRIIVLKNDMKAKTSSSVPSSPQPGESPRDSPVSSATSAAASPGVDAAAESELLCLTSPLDLLCGPVPSCLPSPQLHPDPIGPQQVDLINFEKTQLLTECESEEAAADDPSDPPEHPGATPPPDLRNSLSLSSPGRRDSRSRIKLAANFSFTVGL